MEEGRKGGFGIKDVLIVVPGSKLTVLYSKFEVAIHRPTQLKLYRPYVTSVIACQSAHPASQPASLPANPLQLARSAYCHQTERKQWHSANFSLPASYNSDLDPRRDPVRSIPALEIFDWWDVQPRCKVECCIGGQAGVVRH